MESSILARAQNLPTNGTHTIFMPFVSLRRVQADMENGEIIWPQHDGKNHHLYVKIFDFNCLIQTFDSF